VMRHRRIPVIDRAARRIIGACVARRRAIGFDGPQT
jgi:hypothetical protein